MSFFSHIFFGTICSRKPLSRPPDRRLYVVDTTGLVGTHQKRGNIQPKPRDNLFIMRNLAQFASKENIKMAAVFTGHPLREASEGSNFRGITVHYALNADDQRKQTLRLVLRNRRKNDIVVLTSDKQIEREAMARSAVCMRLSTLRRVLENKEERAAQPRQYQRKSVPERPAARQPGVGSASKNNVKETRDSQVLNLIDPI